MTLPAKGAILTLQDIGLSFGGFAALTGVSLTLARGEVTGLIGPNGAGKTTLLNVMAGLLTPDRGEIRLNGQPITAAAMPRRAGMGLVRTFQIARELGRLTVLENLLLARPNQLGENLLAAWFRRGSIAAEERAAAAHAMAVLERIGIAHMADSMAGALSGGQKKLLELGRALMLRPQLILLDEPAAGVAPPLVERMAELIAELRAEGMSFALVEHDMSLVRAVCDRVCVLAEGTPLMTGSFAEVTTDARVIEAYLGQVAA
jgi:branched-chain amino acid transport system ATP-binding protein/neutral amino acid transport system ATP-binding protein